MKKGSYGYLQSRRKISIIKSAVFLAAVLLIYFAALRHFHTNKNVFSILAAVGALPTGRSIVESIMFVRAKSAPEAVRDALSRVQGLPADSSGYDLCLTAYERTFSVSHITVAGDTVLGLVLDPKTDCGLCGEHIEKMLAQGEKEGYRVRILEDLQTYVSEVEKLCAGPSDRRRDREVMSMLFAISL